MQNLSLQTVLDVFKSIYQWVWCTVCSALIALMRSYCLASHNSCENRKYAETLVYPLKIGWASV